MTDLYEHPRPPQRHRPRITPTDHGAKATCLCGWSRKARSQPAAVRLWLAHYSEASEGGGS